VNPKDSPLTENNCVGWLTRTDDYGLSICLKESSLYENTFIASIPSQRWRTNPQAWQYAPFVGLSQVFSNKTASIDTTPEDFITWVTLYVSSYQTAPTASENLIAQTFFRELLTLNPLWFKQIRSETSPAGRLQRQFRDSQQIST